MSMINVNAELALQCYYTVPYLAVVSWTNLYLTQSYARVMRLGSGWLWLRWRFQGRFIDSAAGSTSLPVPVNQPSTHRVYGQVRQVPEYRGQRTMKKKLPLKMDNLQGLH
jgi:hypothetical protein